MTADLLTQLAEYGRYHETEQLPVDIDEARTRGALVRPLTTERPSETHQRRWSGVMIAVAAAAIILLAVGGIVWLTGAASEVTNEPAVTSVPPTVGPTPTPESPTAEALGTVNAYHAALAAGDTSTAIAQFASTSDPVITVCYSASAGTCVGDPEAWTLGEHEQTETWKRATGAEYRDVSCNPTDDAQIIECTYDEYQAAGAGLAAPPVPAVQTFHTGPGGIAALDTVYGPPDFLNIHDPFSAWVLRNHPDDQAAIECCEWTSIEDARAKGVRTGELFIEWAAYLDRIGCAFNDTSCATSAAFDGFVAAYNSGDIDAAMSYFTPDSQITNYPVVGDADGLEAIRAALAERRAQAAATEPYALSDELVIAFTLSWDHTWVDATGRQWCGTGNSASIAGGKIIDWNHADEAPCP